MLNQQTIHFSVYMKDNILKLIYSSLLLFVFCFRKDKIGRALNLNTYIYDIHLRSCDYGEK